MPFCNFDEIDISSNKLPTDRPTSGQPNNATRPTSFFHVRLTSGHTWHSDARAADCPDTAVIKPLALKSLKEKKSVPVPMLGSVISMQVLPTDGAFFVEVFSSSGSTKLPVFTLGISLDGQSGRGLWRRLNEEAKLPCLVSPDAPEGPWIATRFEPAIVTLPFSTTMFLENFESGIAWSLVELAFEDAMEGSAGIPAGLHPAKSKHKRDLVGFVDSSNMKKGGSLAYLKTTRMPEGATLDFHREAGPTLYISLDTPETSEQENIRTGEARFALAERNGVAFLLVKFGSEQWMDAPYHAGLYAPELRGVPDEYEDGKRLALAVLIIDSATGQQCGARLLSLDPIFSSRFIALVKRQMASPMARSTYDEFIRKAYRAFPTSRTMLSIATAKCTGGN